MSESGRRLRGRIAIVAAVSALGALLARLAAPDVVPSDARGIAAAVRCVGGAAGLRALARGAVACGTRVTDAADDINVFTGLSRRF